MVDDRKEWEICEEREGEERRCAGQNACTRSYVGATGGIFSAFLGQKCFLPQKETKNPPKFTQLKTGVGVGVVTVSY
jgi:hypothetical protein